MREGDSLLQICSHIANGAKHFKATAAHHTSVKNAMLSAAAFQPDALNPGDFQSRGWLVVELDGHAADRFGPHIEVVVLAGKLLDFWTGLLEAKQGKATA